MLEHPLACADHGWMIRGHAEVEKLVHLKSRPDHYFRPPAVWFVRL